MPFQPIHDKRLSDQIAEQLTRAMHTGELTEGTRLPPEAQLAAQLGVSRGILREALTVLEAQGYLSRAPKGGTFIKSTSGDELGRELSIQLRKATYRDLLEFREIMECRAVETISKSATDSQLEELMEVALMPLSAETPGKLDRYFHYHLADLSGNSLFPTFINMYYDLISEIRTQSLKTTDRNEAIANEHLAIAKALIVRDVKAAKKAVRNHLSAVWRSVQTGGVQSARSRKEPADG